jgi:hypothetical protein
MSINDFYLGGCFMKDFLKTGVIFNIKSLKENRPELWEKYKVHFENITFENEEVYLNYLTDKMDGQVLFNLLTNCLPVEMRKRLNLN